MCKVLDDVFDFTQCRCAATRTYLPEEPGEHRLHRLPLPLSLPLLGLLLLHWRFFALPPLPYLPPLLPLHGLLLAHRLRRLLPLGQPLRPDGQLLVHLLPLPLLSRLLLRLPLEPPPTHPFRATRLRPRPLLTPLPLAPGLGGPLRSVGKSPYLETLLLRLPHGPRHPAALLDPQPELQLPLHPGRLPPLPLLLLLTLRGPKALCRLLERLLAFLLHLPLKLRVAGVHPFGAVLPRPLHLDVLLLQTLVPQMWPPQLPLLRLVVVPLYAALLRWLCQRPHRRGPAAFRSHRGGLLLRPLPLLLPLLYQLSQLWAPRPNLPLHPPVLRLPAVPRVPQLPPLHAS